MAVSSTPKMNMRLILMSSILKSARLIVFPYMSKQDDGTKQLSKITINDTMNYFLDAQYIYQLPSSLSRSVLAGVPGRGGRPRGFEYVV